MANIRQIEEIISTLKAAEKQAQTIYNEEKDRAARAIIGKMEDEITRARQNVAALAKTNDW